MSWFWEDLFDFNGNGKVDADEKFLGMVTMEDEYRELRRKAREPLNDSEDKPHSDW